MRTIKLKKLLKEEISSVYDIENIASELISKCDDPKFKELIDDLSDAQYDLRDSGLADNRELQNDLREALEHYNDFYKTLIDLAKSVGKQK